MRQILILLAFLLASITMGAQHTGKLVFEKEPATGFTKIYLDSKPSFPAWPWPDSGAVRVRVYCYNWEFETQRMAWNDTLYYDFSGRVVVTGAIEWFRNGNYITQTQFPVPSIQGGYVDDCFEFKGVNVSASPVTASAVTPELWWDNGLNGNIGGTLIMFNPLYQVETETFAGPFNYQVPTGTWSIYLILNDGSTIYAP